MSEPKRRWFDDAAGPVVRPYAVTRGRTRTRGTPMDIVATVVGVTPSASDRMRLEPEHLFLLARCRRPTTVVDLAADADLPIDVVRVLLGDLRDMLLVTVNAPVSPTFVRDERVLRTVLNELYFL